MRRMPGRHSPILDGENGRSIACSQGLRRVGTAQQKHAVKLVDTGGRPCGNRSNLVIPPVTHAEEMGVAMPDGGKGG